MNKLLLNTALTFALSVPAFAAGTHDGGHGHDMMAIGASADSEPDRTIAVTMRETEDGAMLFEPAQLDFAAGETVRIVVTNAGELDHEFVMDSPDKNAEHKIMMEKFPEMEHDDPNAVRLDPGATGEILWTFSNVGTFEFACLIPGHYEAGMYGPITVSQKMAQAEAEYTTGTIKKIDAKAGKVTISHGPLINLDMPAMTMVFRADEAMISNMSEGQDIEFLVERVNGKLTVTATK